MRSIDVNTDLGESFGAWTMGHDAGVLPFVSSANIACGFHAGDPMTMQRTVRAALDRGVAIGAHPSFPDLQGFGRREMQISAQEVHCIVLYQIGALAAFVRAAGGRLGHVKPHGALYNMAARDPSLADAIADAVRAFDDKLLLVGLAGSELPRAGVRAGLAVAHEAFTDRRYRRDGSLVPRGEPGAVIDDMGAVTAQAVSIARDGCVTADDGSTLRISADTLCLHTDRADAPAFAEELQYGLMAALIRIHPIDRGRRA